MRLGFDVQEDVVGVRRRKGEAYLGGHSIERGPATFRPDPLIIEVSRRKSIGVHPLGLLGMAIEGWSAQDSEPRLIKCSGPGPKQNPAKQRAAALRAKKQAHLKKLAKQDQKRKVGKMPAKKRALAAGTPKRTQNKVRAPQSP